MNVSYAIENDMQDSNQRFDSQTIWAVLEDGRTSRTRKETVGHLYVKL